MIFFLITLVILVTVTRCQYKGVCELGNEACWCSANINLFIMNCLSPSEQARRLDFGTLKHSSSQLNLTLELDIQNKYFNEIKQTSYLNNAMTSLVVRLLLANNRIESPLKNATFVSLHGLIHADLQNNQLDDIELDSFVGLPRLSVLLLSANKLSIVKNSTFRHLTSLTFLAMNNNKIASLDVDAFWGLQNLQELYLHANKIEAIQSGTFKNLNRLQVLWLFQNALVSLETNSFYGLSQLSALEIYANRIKCLRQGFFYSLDSVTTLHVLFNEISDMESNTFAGLSNLTKLVLNSNRIKQLRNGVFTGLHKLVSLKLSANEIMSIEKQAFDNLSGLDALELESNKLKQIQKGHFDQLVELQYLYLFENQLANIEPYSFGQLKKLKLLDLSSNKLESLQYKAFADLTSLAILNLAANYLTSIELKYLANLTLLNLSGNYLDTQVNLAGLTSLVELDLSFNYVKRLEKSFFSDMCALKTLHLTNNKLDFLENLAFENTPNLIHLNLGFNRLVQLSRSVLCSLSKLTELVLKSNLLARIDSIIWNIKCLASLETLDLANNFIESVADHDFELNLNLQVLNLNANPIKFIQDSAFRELKSLRSFQMAHSRLDCFNVSLLNSEYLADLDLSFNCISFEDIRLKSLRNANFKGVQSNKSLEEFLNSELTSLDFSGHNFNGDFKRLNALTNVEVLKLRHIGLESMKAIDFVNFPRLSHLDLALNNLTRLLSDSFVPLDKLVYLDLSHNQIEFVDENIFGLPESSVLYPLEFLNLEHNRITFMGSHMFNVLALNVFRMSHNLLAMYPAYDAINIEGDFDLSAKEFYFNNNKLRCVKPFSGFASSLAKLSLEFNDIEFIEQNAMSMLKKLESLRLSHNLLPNITADNFYSLFSLKYLNLSHNRIQSIAQNSFQNLGKLEILDASFNSLLEIENNLFTGLSGLKDLHLLNAYGLKLYNRSFSDLTALSNIYLNESVVSSNKCLFMHSIERQIQRSVASRFIYFKSLNLISAEILVYNCYLKFNFIQFMVLFNLKSDHEYELFVEKCQFVLISQRNNFKHRFKECFAKFELQENSELNEFLTENTSLILYVCTMIVLVLFLSAPLSVIYIHLCNKGNRKMYIVAK